MDGLEFWKDRCLTCRQELEHFVYHKGKVIDIKGCQCKGSRQFEQVPMTKQGYEKRFN